MSPSPWHTHVRCGIGSSSVSDFRRSTRSFVSSRVDPPAPYVTLTNVGRSGCSRAMLSNSPAAPFSVLGGKNSNENVVPSRWM